jgi:hypothetical protein
MFVLCVLYNKDKRQSKDKAVQTKYRERTKKNPGRVEFSWAGIAYSP